MQTNKDNSGSGSSSSTTPNPQTGANQDSNSGGVGSAMGGSLAGVDLGPSMLSAAGPAATSGPSIPAGTGPGGTPTTALSVYHLITQLCQRPDPTSMANAAKGIISTQQGQVPALNATGAEALAGSSTQRETALLELSKKREQYEDLALVLWHSFGVYHCHFTEMERLTLHLQASCHRCCRRSSRCTRFCLHPHSLPMHLIESATLLLFCSV